MVTKDRLLDGALKVLGAYVPLLGPSLISDQDLLFPEYLRGRFSLSCFILSFLSNAKLSRLLSSLKKRKKLPYKAHLCPQPVTLVPQA